MLTCTDMNNRLGDLAIGLEQRNLLRRTQTGEESKLVIVPDGGAPIVTRNQKRIE